jgi:endonuclease/exonuclease/phosphatase family metal-dependent hydrolase
MGRSGGLWMLWSDEVHVSVKFFNQYMILAIVVDRATNADFVLACIYGDPHHQQTRMIWDNVYNFVCENLGKPVVCFGDLNDILCDMDTTSINVNKFRMRTFNSYVKQCGLFDLGYSGPAYTWTNKRFASNPIFERLDRCLANAEWCTLFPNTNVFNLPIILSDHAPILVSTESKHQRPRLHFNLKIGGLMKKIFSVLPKMLGLLQLVGLSMLEQLILQVL